MATRQSTMTALHKLAGDVADHVEIVVSAGEAEASEGNVVALGAARGAVSEFSLHGSGDSM